MQLQQSYHSNSLARSPHLHNRVEERKPVARPRLPSSDMVSQNQRYNCMLCNHKRTVGSRQSSDWNSGPFSQSSIQSGSPDVDDRGVYWVDIVCRVLLHVGGTAEQARNVRAEVGAHRLQVRAP